MKELHLKERARFYSRLPGFYRHALRRRPRQGLFVILFGGRTGSSYIVSCLNSHPSVVCYPEIFRSVGPRSQARILNGLRLGVRLERIYPFAGSDDIFPSQPLDAKSAPDLVGFKVKVRDIRSPEHFRRRIRSDNYTVIHLIRRNVVKTVISKINVGDLRNRHERANITDLSMRSQRSLATTEQIRKHIEIREEHIAEEKAFVRSLGVRTHEIAYEDMLADPTSFFGNLQQLIGVEPQPLVGSFVKNTPNDLRETLANFDEIRSEFAGTPYYDQFGD